MSRWVSLIVLACGCSAIAQQGIVIPQNEPTNLNTVKLALQRYHSCSEPTCYGPQLEHQADIAIRFLKESLATAKPGDKLAIVLDIDETALSNWAVEVHDDFGYIAADSNSCVVLRCGKAIPSALRIFEEAEKDKVAVFFITGRPEGQRADTAANLEGRRLRSLGGPLFAARRSPERSDRVGIQVWGSRKNRCQWIPNRPQRWRPDERSSWGPTSGTLGETAKSLLFHSMSFGSMRPAYDCQRRSRWPICDRSFQFNS